MGEATYAERMTASVKTLVVVQREFRNYPGATDGPRFVDHGPGIAPENDELVERWMTSARASIENNPDVYTGRYRSLRREIVTTETEIEEFEA